MEQSSAQNRMPGLPHGTPQDALPQEYWNNLDALYPNQLQAAQQQQQNPDAEQPLGIGWDHPVFQQQQHQSSPQPHQSTHIPPQNEQNHGIYSIPQSWQANPLQQPTRSFGVHSPFQPQQTHQVPQFHQDQMQFDSRAMPPDTSAFPQYSFQSQYFPNQQLPAHDSFQERPPQQRLPSGYQAPQAMMPQFDMHHSFPPDLLNPTIDLTEDFPSASAHNNTIDPQFLNPTLQARQEPRPMQNGYMFAQPAGIPPQGGQVFDYYQNGIMLQPQPRNPNTPGTQPEVDEYSKLTGLPIPQVVIHSANPNAKKPGRPKKATTTTKKPKTSQQSDSSDDSGSDIEAPPEPSPIPPQRPTGRLEAAGYDTMQAVWAPRNKRVTAEKVKGALVAYKDLVKTLRDSWKEQVRSMKLAENAGDNEKANALKQDVTLQRAMMDRILETTLNVGHPVIIEKLGEHPMTLSAIQSFIVDRFQAADYDGSLTTNTLRVLVRFITVDEEMLEKINLTKVLPRLMKKSGPLVKELAQKILDNAKASTKRKQTSKSNEESPTKRPARNPPSVDPVGVKRLREGDGSVQPAKRVVTANPKDSSGKPAPATSGPVKRPTETVPNGKPAAPAAFRPKPVHVQPKTSSLFGALSSASKRPGTTNAERAAAAAATKANPPPEKKEKAPPPKPAFSFGDLMADLNKPKETVAAKPAEDRPPETEKERQKRLRKEERRKLRVSWKPDESLTEVRLFTHDPEEELNPEDGSMNGVGANVKSEGDALRLHKDKEVEADDEDLGGGIREIELHDYQALSVIDIDSEELKNSNFIKRGGNRQPISAEKDAQDHREATTLMVFYSSPADVPSTPKEPPAADEDEAVTEVVDFGELPESVKTKQEQYYNHINPKPGVPPQPQQQPNPAAANGGFDISNLLKMMQPGNQQQSTPPPQAVPQAPQAPLSDLERTVNMFRQQQTVPQVPQPQPPAAPASAPVDFASILNVMKQLQQPNNAFQQPQPQPQPQAAMAPNLNAIFGQFAGQNNAAGANNQTAGTYEDPERKRMRDGGGQYDSQGNEQWSRGKRTKANAPQPYKVGLVPCRFWAEGKCRKGENCTFRHDT